MRFSPGDRIRISSEYNLAQGTTGTIDYPPEFAVHLVEEESPWVGCHRFVKGKKGLIEFYWVWFDNPQNDPDGDGPNKGGEIEVEAIEYL